MSGAEAVIPVRSPSVQRDAVLPGSDVEASLPGPVGRHLVGQRDLYFRGRPHDKSVPPVEQRPVFGPYAVDIGLYLSRDDGAHVLPSRDSGPAALAATVDGRPPPAPDSAENEGRETGARPRVSFGVGARREGAEDADGEGALRRPCRLVRRVEQTARRTQY